MQRISHGSWGTDSEIEFIKKLGNHRGCAELSRKELLTNYIHAARNRNNWGPVKSDQVIAYAEAELAFEN